MPVSTVELHPAWIWTCDGCGRDNFARSVVPESLEGQLLEGLELEDFEQGEWITRPSRVTCWHCGTEFETEEG